jgi:ABC-type nitrate/sulfonate/bicarbonate transport system substrate-binding protein
MEKITLKLGGVPEHFNLPIHLAKERGKFKNRGIDLQWTNFDGGTGQMTKALRNKEIDACILLTEGIIKDIANGNPSKIVSVYVNSPLTWGIHTGVDNKLMNHSEIYTQKYAISRFGSGSHLMPIVDATSQDKSLDESQFKIINNLTGALESLEKGETDVFYWEKFTTKPYVDAGKLRRIGEYVPPWPCFVIAVRNEVLEQSPEAIIRMLRIIHDECDKFMYNENAIDLVSERYNLLKKDVERWFNSTEWAIHGWVTDKMLKNVVYNLNVAGILDKDQELPELVWKR